MTVEIIETKFYMKGIEETCRHVDIDFNTILPDGRLHCHICGRVFSMKVMSREEFNIELGIENTLLMGAEITRAEISTLDEDTLYNLYRETMVKISPPRKVKRRLRDDSKKDSVFAKAWKELVTAKSKEWREVIEANKEEPGKEAWRFVEEDNTVDDDL